MQSSNNNNNNKNDIMLPVGGVPYWDQEYSEDTDEGKGLKSVSESFVLLKSLKQSRDRWLHSTFPKFSTKTRGNKAPEIVQPPHTIQPRGRYDLEIGPHLFPDTVLYEVNYLPSEAPITSSAPVTNPPSNPYWQPTVPYGYSYRYASSNPTRLASTAGPVMPSAPNVSSGSTTVSPAETSGTTSNSSERVPTPLISSLSTVSIITPSLISQVNAAASANPIFSNLLQLAAAKTATEDQLQTLGLLIQSLAAMNVPQQQFMPPAVPNTDYYQAPPPAQAPVKPFDLVLEFREHPGDRWLFPRGTVCTERLTTSNNIINNADVLITMCLSNDGKVCVELDDQIVQDASPGDSGLYTASIRLKECPPYVWDILLRWIGGQDQNTMNRKQLDNLVQPKRLFLGLQLSPGPTLSQLQAACAPSYSMRLVRQGPAPQSRASRQRKPYAEKKAISSTKTTASIGENVPAKKPRGSTSKAAATPIQCVSCKQTDVPLILGGRYCRPCVDAGNHNPTTLPTPTAPTIAQPAADPNTSSHIPA